MIDSVPLIQNVAKDDINTSIIALKKEEKRLEQLIAEADAKIKELNELKVNVSDIVNEVTSGNMYSVTSNAVSEALSYSTEEVFTGSYWIDRKKIYKKVFVCSANATFASNSWYNLVLCFSGLGSLVPLIDKVVSVSFFITKNYQYMGVFYKDYPHTGNFGFISPYGNDIQANEGKLILLYTKATD